MGLIWREARQGLRTLAKNPGFAAVAVLTLALGIGANTAIFSVVDAALLRPLPYPHADRIVALYSTDARHNSFDGRLSYSLYDQVRFSVAPVASLAGYVQWPFTITKPGQPEVVLGVAATESFFSVLGIRPIRGRLYSSADEIGGQAVALISQRLWRERFHSDPSLLGNTIELDHRPYTVLGILPESLRFPMMQVTPQVWLPLSEPSMKQLFSTISSSLTSALSGKGGSPGLSPDRLSMVQVIGLLEPGATPAQVQARAATTAQGFAREHPEETKDLGIRVALLEQELQKGHGTALWLLLGAVGLVLLIACVNIANLLLARATTRQREFALRMALGAGRIGILRQVLVESLELAVVGGLFGAYSGYLAIAYLPDWLPQSFSRVPRAGLNGDVLLFTAAISLAAGLLFGSLPALGLADLKMYAALKEGGRSSSEGMRGRRLRGALVVIEVALAVILLSGSGLLLRSLLRILSVNPGYDPHDLLLTQLDLPTRQYSKPDQWRNFVDETVNRLRALPGVEQAAAAVTPPVGHMRVGISLTYQLAGHPLPEDKQPEAALLPVSPGYFQLMKIPLLRGRAITANDLQGATPICVANRALAENELSGQELLGRRLEFAKTGNSCEIVGEVGNVREGSLTSKPGPVVYIPYDQFPFPFVSFLLRTSLAPPSLEAGVRNAIQTAAPGLQVNSLYSVNRLLSETTSQARFQALLVGIFAALATLLAAVGISGVLSYSVSRRTQEIGVRIALGAQPGDVLRQVVGEGFRLVGMGAAVGIAAALGLTRFMRTLLYGVSPADAMTYVVVALVLLVVALVACALPAARAARVDPTVALRYE